jgi:predicted PurR-regulated permease PerM
MSDIDPLIRRELQWMALGVLENRDLSTLVIDRVRKRRRKRALIVASMVISSILIASVTYLAIDSITQGSSSASSTSNGAVGSTDENAIDADQIVGVISDYPITWEQSVGDVGAISKAAGLNDTLGGLTAIGLKVSWEQCRLLKKQKQI